jgi:hypothetical protein
MSLTVAKINAIDTFIRGEKTAGRWDGIKRLYFPVWGLEAANAICMKSLTSCTFVGGMTPGAGYIQGDGVTGYANTNTTPSSIGLTKDSYYAGYLCIERQQDGHFDFGVGGGGVSGDFHTVNQFSYNEDTEETRFFRTIMRVAGKFLEHSVPISTLYSVSGTTSSGFIKDRTSSGVTTRATSNATSTLDLADVNLCLTTTNSAFGISPLKNNSKYGAFFFGTALSDAQDTAYTLALKNLWETVTGLTLP